jgi:hypothetical protein
MITRRYNTMKSISSAKTSNKIFGTHKSCFIPKITKGSESKLLPVAINSYFDE